MDKNISTTTPKTLGNLIKNAPTVQLIDVRTPAEYRECHAASAQNIPLDSLDPKMILGLKKGSKETPLYIICQSGNRSKMACEKFNMIGHHHVVNVEGGTKAWQEEGLPVVRGKKNLSLERQIRIITGTIVFVGAVLGWIIHPAFISLSAFVGAGLMFSGITDTCAMGMMLTKMPWNKA
jgi:rhodanese-related sulfurtransferase